MPFVRYEGRWDSGGPVGAELRVEGKAPVDEDSLSRDVGGLIGAEVGGQPCHLLRGAGAPHRDMTLHHRPCLGVIDPGPIDGVAPGATPFTRMPCGAYSRARVRVRFCIPPLLAE